MLLFVDKMTLDGEPRRTADGYLVASPKVARTGIQIYKGSEVGRPSFDTVKVYRPEDEVFSKDALFSFGHRPVTMDHPPEMVDASNWNKYAKGTTGGDIARDGDFITVPMALMDADSIKQVEDGKRELSMGYTADLDFTPGKTPDGEAYDAVQRNIRGNHLAIVDRARGGPELRVFDTANFKPQPSQQELFTMNMKTIVVDGINVEVPDTAAQVVAKFTKDMEGEMEKKDKRIADLEKELDEFKAKMKKDGETKDAEIETLKKKVSDAELTPQKLDDAVKAREAVITAAKKAMPQVVTDGKTDNEIRKQVVANAMGDTAKDWNDDQIAASFNTLTAGSVQQDAYVASHMQQQQNGGAGPGNVTHLQKRDQRLADAWKHPSQKEA